VVGVAVDTTVAVVKVPFQIAGAVVGVAADTTGAVIEAPFRVVDAAFGGKHDQYKDSHKKQDHVSLSKQSHMTIIMAVISIFANISIRTVKTMVDSNNNSQDLSYSSAQIVASRSALRY
jgi:hypothetical protein